MSFHSEKINTGDWEELRGGEGLFDQGLGRGFPSIDTAVEVVDVREPELFEDF